MKQLNYGPLLDSWKVDLIRHRATRIGFYGHEIPDLLQALVPVVAAFHYDPANATGASEETALRALIDNHLKSVCRQNARYRQRLARYAAEPHAELTSDDAVVRTRDVQAVVALLSDHERAVCQALAEGDSRLDIAKSLSCSWHTVNRHMMRIRKHFHAHGLDSYLTAEGGLV